MAEGDSFGQSSETKDALIDPKMEQIHILFIFLLHSFHPNFKIISQTDLKFKSRWSIYLYLIQHQIIKLLINLRLSVEIYYKMAATFSFMRRNSIPKSPMNEISQNEISFL